MLITFNLAKNLCINQIFYIENFFKANFKGDLFTL